MAPQLLPNPEIIIITTWGCPHDTVTLKSPLLIISYNILICPPRFVYYYYQYMGVSTNDGTTKSSIYGGFPYKPSTLGYLWKPPKIINIIYIYICIAIE